MPKKYSRDPEDVAGRVAIKEIKKHYSKRHDMYRYVGGFDADSFLPSAKWERYALDYDTEFNIILEFQHYGLELFETRRTQSDSYHISSGRGAIHLKARPVCWRELSPFFKTY